MSVLQQMAGPFRDLKVTGFMADDAACGNYRIRFPLEFLRRQGAEVQLIEKKLSVNPAGDIILAQRQYDAGIYDMLMEMKDLGKTIIYEIDDNVHKVHPGSVAFNVYKPGGETCKGVERFIRGCDGLFVTSAELASQYRHLNPKVWVLPNCIDFGFRDWENQVPRDPRLEGFTVIGWAGSITHQDDWQPLVGVLDKVLAKYPSTIFAMVSAYRTMDTFLQALDLPADRVVQLNPVDFPEYPALPAQFDIGLVPVVSTPFNLAKSDLKIIEYGARRVPYVASKLAPYVRFHEETGGKGGFIANTASEWIDAISQLVENAEERKARSQWIVDYVRAERAYDTNAYRWAEALREAKHLKFNEPAAVRQYVVPEKLGRNDPCPCGSGSKYKRCHAPAWG